MLIRIDRLHRYRLGALDGEIGRIKDCYFDDQNWAFRYLVADTGSWLPGRLVLLSPRAFGKLDHEGKVLRVNLTRQQIEGSPSIESHKPLSRQYEEKYHRYYDWPFYWSGDAIWGMGGFPILTELPGQFEGEPSHKHRGKKSSADAHLRSAHVVMHYDIRARDGMIGRLSDFLLDVEKWTIQNLIVHTGPWLSGKDVLISPSAVERISWNESTVIVNATKAAISEAPIFDESGATAPREMSIFV